MTAYVPNPTRPGGRKPVELITDRAKRYRARKAMPAGPRCVYCGAPEPRDIDHVDGNEAHNNPANLAPACRSCNTAKGANFARRKVGRRTMQYNPDPSAGAKSLAQWVIAVMALKGQSSEMSVQDAITMVQNTPPQKRSEFAREIWRRRQQRGTAGRKRRGKYDDEVPF